MTLRLLHRPSRTLQFVLVPLLVAWLLAARLVACSYPGPGPFHASPVAQQAQVYPQAEPAGRDGAPSPTSRLPSTLQALLEAVEVMQDRYFEVFTATWPNAIDWTAAVLGTHVSATLSTIVSSFDSSTVSCSERLAWENIVDRYFSHISVFYFGENALSLRNQAYDDMLWVVLGWLENIKFVHMYTYTHWDPSRNKSYGKGWHGLQFSPVAAHRARIFHELASNGWDTSLCEGGMTWNRHLNPYKNAITNELFISASISMYLYFPGDDIDSPFVAGSAPGLYEPHDPRHLAMAIKGYRWLQRSRMKNYAGLYADGFHVTGWRRLSNGTVNHGTGNCDKLNHMVYTYNQGVLLSAHRGLWMATGAKSYLEDGHELVTNVIRATGWPLEIDGTWHGLGRDGVLEEFCDHIGNCSQDGHTFKGIFYHHLAEFCRPLWPHEEDFIGATVRGGLDPSAYQYHQARCFSYEPWIEHNANAALATRDEEGCFGMWWGRAFPDTHSQDVPRVPLAEGAVDYRNQGIPPGHNGTWLLEHSVGKPDARPPVMAKPVATGPHHGRREVNDRGRGRTVETQSGGVAVLRALWQWKSTIVKVRGQ